MVMIIPGEPICGLEGVARPKGGIEGGVGGGLALLERGEGSLMFWPINLILAH